MATSIGQTEKKPIPKPQKKWRRRGRTTRQAVGTHKMC